MVVSKSQLKGAAPSVQASVQVLVPAGAVWKRTLVIPRSEAAVAASGTVARSGLPGSVSATATVLKSAAVEKVVFAFALAATNVALEEPTRSGISAASSAKAKKARFTRGLRRARRRCRATGRPGW